MSTTTLSPLLLEKNQEGLPANEERLATALSAVINAAGVGATEALRVMRVVSERIPMPDVTPEEAAFERVRLRSIGVEEEICHAEGGGLSDAEFAARLGLGSRETVRQYRKSGRIFAWRKDSRSYRYPAWQIYQKGLLPGLAEVLQVLINEKGLSPFSIACHFLTPSTELDEARPLDLLRQGKVDEVVADARRYGDIGA